MDNINALITTLIALLTSGIVGSIVYHKQNKRVREAEAKVSEEQAKQSSVETQEKQVNLAQQVLELVSDKLTEFGKKTELAAQESKNDQFKKLDQLSQQMTSLGSAQDRLLQNQESMLTRLDKVEAQTSSINAKNEEQDLWIRCIQKLLNGDLKNIVREYRHDFADKGIDVTKYLNE